MYTIEIEGITKQFPGSPRPAVDRVSFGVKAQSFVALLGPSGCGKTTLLRMINRLIEPDGGRILINGRNTQQIPPTELRRQIGYAIQQTGLFPHMRVGENIAVVPTLLGWSAARIRVRVEELLALVGLPDHYQRRYPRQLSGGEQQRVGLARALAADPDLLLMDEPFGAIDAIQRARLQDELLLIQRRLRKTILFVTHDVEEALRLADAILIMRDGELVQYDTPLQMVTAPRDRFVQQLLGTDDRLRYLSLLPVSAALPEVVADAPLAPGTPTVSPHDDLRHALGVLLQSAQPTVAVVGDAGQPMGRLSFDDLRRVTQRDAMAKIEAR